MMAAALSAAACFAQAKDDPNPFSTYTLGMASDRNWPMAVEWQDANRAAIDAATQEDVLAAFVADEAAAEALLAKICDAYRSDPLVLTQVAAVSQWTMSEEPCWLCFWRPSPAAGRRVWTAALLKKAQSSPVEYVRMVCLEQLRWCGASAQAAALRTLADGAASKAVWEFALWTAAELETRKDD